MAVCGQRALGREIDVEVTVNKPQVAELTDFSVILIGTNDATFDQGERLRYYSDSDGVLEDFLATSEAYKAASSFFSQTPRPSRVGIGRIFYPTDAPSGFMEGREISAVAADFIAISDGEFTISIDGDSQDITGLDFTLDSDFADFAATIQAALQAVGTGGYSAATCVYDATNSRFEIASGTTGDSSTVSSLTPVSGGGGTDISGASYLDMFDDPGTDADNLRIIDGYTPTTLADELSRLDQTSSACLGVTWYGLTLTAEFRDAGTGLPASDYGIRDAADWAETKIKLHAIDSNDSNLLSSSQTSDIASYIKTNGLRRSFVSYSPFANDYQGISALAYLLSVDFAATESVVTLKFKDLPSVATVPLTTTELAVLQNKRANALTLVQNDLRVYREGTTGNSNWFIDETFNLDGLADTVQTEVYTAFLQNGRIGFNSAGEATLRAAITKACQRFVRNGALTAREKDDTVVREVEPAFIIDIPSALQLSQSDRAARLWSGITITANLTGAVHSTTIRINAFV